MDYNWNVDVLDSIFLLPEKKKFNYCSQVIHSKLVLCSQLCLGFFYLHTLRQSHSRTLSRTHALSQSEDKV